MLSKWFNLSDPGLEEALLDRIGFRKFVGLSSADATPDEHYLCQVSQADARGQAR
jgi:transposase, IS5 family